MKAQSTNLAVPKTTEIPWTLGCCTSGGLGRSSSYTTDSNNDGVYETVSPGDEKRTLTKTASGWTLKDLNGTIEMFDSTGLWISTADRNVRTLVATV